MQYFSKPEPSAQFKHFIKEQKTGEWFVENAVSTFEIVSRRLFEINK